MAQKGTGKGKRAPAYSADTMALRLICGLALIALGTLIFLAVDLGMNGPVFDSLRGLCFGLTGALAYVLPVLPLWAGVLTVYSTQRRAPVRPWIFALLAFIGIGTFILITTTQGRYLESISGGDGTWGDAVSRVFNDCRRLKTSGGALGAIFGWPLWRYLGTILGAALSVLVSVFCVLMAADLTPRRILNLLSGKAAREMDMRAESNVQQIAWQQQQAMMAEQERQRQLAWQQQAYAANQQPGYPQQPAYTADPQQGYPQQAMPLNGDRQPGYAAESLQTQSQTSVQQPVRSGQDDRGIADWQQTGLQDTGAGAGGQHESRLFGRKKTDGADEKTVPGGKSRIFGKKEAYDGLSDASADQTGYPARPASDGRQQTGNRYGEQNTAPVRRTATGNELGRPETRWNIPDESAREGRQSGRTDGERNGRTADKRAAASPVSEANGNCRERGERPLNPVGTQSSAGISDTEKTAAPVDTGYPRATGNTEEKPAARTRKETPAPVSAAEKTGTERSAGEPENTAKQKPQKTEQITIPKVQQEIGLEAWKPVLKGPAGDKPAAGTEEDDGWAPFPYNYPLVTDLNPRQMNTENTGAEDEYRSRKLEETLLSFRVQARVVHVTHGPAVSRFELELASGTKVSKVAELEKDIAYGMEATSVRIEAPIPGKSLVGVEVPNRKVSVVTLREVLEDDRMQNARSILTVALGKDIAGTPIVCDLAKMPHMLIAGATGSGKSVCINAIINSLLFRAGPDEVRLILIDPKVVELQCYEHIPHLLIPVVNDPHKAAAALAWAVAEMMERYDRFAERRVRNLDGYNASLAENEKPMPRIVIIIDELADLMMVCKKDVEEYICRLTQLARAAGIHLIVATQRPSVDVITGLIKANIPSRIAFKTASYVDSRTILDRNGAEQLLGYGDMLYLPTGSFAPTRVQGCFLTDDEVNRVAKHVREANPSTYDPDILDKLEKISSGSGELPGADMIGGSPESGGDSDLFAQAVEYAISDGQISTSTLQRRLKIGYARAGRLTDEMEERGIVSAKDGSKPRKCLITREEWEEIRKSAEA